MKKSLALFSVITTSLLAIIFIPSTTLAGDTPVALSYIVATSSATSTWQGGALFGLTSGFVGIGTTNPLAPIQVGNYPANNSVGSQILISRDVGNASGSGNAHAFSDSSLLDRSGNIGYNSYDARITIAGGVNYDHYAAFQALPQYNNGAGTIKNYYGFYTGIGANAGTVTNSYGTYVSNPSGTGAVTNNYGLYVDAMTRGSAKNYGVYTAGTNPNYFGGNVGIGTTTPYASLSVAGASGVVADIFTALSPTSISTFFGGLKLPTLTCSTLANGGKLSLDKNGNVICLDDISGGTSSGNSGTTISGTAVFFSGATFATQGGNVGIGSSTPADTFTVEHQANIHTTNNNVFSVGYSTSGLSTTSAFVISAATLNVGIGTSTPGSKLSVVGNANITGSLSVGTGAITAANFVGSSNQATSSFAGGFTIGTSGFVYDWQTHKLGVGIFDPSSMLDVAIVNPGTVVGTNLNSFMADRSGAIGNLTQIGFGFRNTFQTIAPAIMGGIVENGSGATKEGLFFATRDNTSNVAPLERVRIAATGNVGIGTKIPATKLHISNGVNATTTISIGELGLTSSKACINMNQVDGSAGSFYIANGAIKVENNYCK